MQLSFSDLLNKIATSSQETAIKLLSVEALWLEALQCPSLKQLDLISQDPVMDVLLSRKQNRPSKHHFQQQWDSWQGSANARKK